MSLPRTRSKFGGDFLVPSFHGNIESIPRNGVQCRKFCRNSAKENSECSASSTEMNNNSRRHSKKMNKDKSILRGPLKDKNIGDSGFTSNSKIFRSSRSSRVSSCYDEDQEEQMETARNTSESNIENLREKCISLNFEFNQLQERHGDYLTNQSFSQNSADDEDYNSDTSDITLERKYTQIFLQSSRPTPPAKKQQENGNRILEDKEKKSHNNKDLKIILKTLKQIVKTAPVASKDSSEMAKLYETVKNLQEEQENFRNLISSQQDQLNNFQSKYLKAENIIKSQKCEIQKLNFANTQLENELNSNITELKEKLQDKTNEAAHLPQAIKAEKIKVEKLSKQNCELITRVQEVKHELALTRAKLVEAAQKRTTTLTKLKASEKDLKIFKNQNTILKTEKRTLIEELKRLKTLNDELSKRNSHNLTRQKERGESQQRLLQKKILDLELELTRSRNSTSDLVEERDKLIAELHQQLNTLVHNFEVSQKHIRMLRKHIHSMSGNSSETIKAK
ncbi:outer dense fiber protein 2 [Episyrphus balteatus]|uniref:outer dense fiber protein 2 n=1 Tax=Episyrphus balteatus TaxID=286459 RepID=UPI002485ABDD|nr:outer dense fiber protein 2 [Episyrphus balteatus]